jgi:hypothetical protein
MHVGTADAQTEVSNQGMSLMSTFSFQEYAQYRPADVAFEPIDDPIGAAERRYAEAEGRTFGRRDAKVGRVRLARNKSAALKSR